MTQPDAPSDQADLDWHRADGVADANLLIDRLTGEGNASHLVRNLAYYDTLWDILSDRPTPFFHAWLSGVRDTLREHCDRGNDTEHEE